MRDDLSCLLVIGLCANCFLSSGNAEEEPTRVVSALNEMDKSEPVGERPYEMVWANRKEKRTPLIDFEDLGGWTAECYAGAQAELRRSREQQMWGRFVGKVTFSGDSMNSRFILKPPEPVRIAGKFDCINLWAYGNNWGFMKRDPNNPRVQIAIHLKDAQGAPFRVPLTHVRWKEWWLVHTRMGKQMLEKASFPCSFAGIEISGCTNERTSKLFLDSLSFYTEELKPLAFEPRPKRNIEPRPGQSMGTNTGPGTLPFPTRKETILPSNLEADFANNVRQTGPADFVFEYRGKDSHIEYVYRPTTGILSEITAHVKGSKVCRPLAEGGIKFEDKAEVERMRLKSASLSDGVVSVVFSSSYGDVEYRLWIWQKSLVIEATCLSGKATELTMGYADEVQNPRRVRIPYIVMGLDFPCVLLLRGRDPLFVSCWADWYNSNASRLYAQTWTRTTSCRFNGGAKYEPKTDGKRNALFERLFLTVSPMFEEVLPTIPNPRSPVGKTAGEYVYAMGWQAHVGTKEDLFKEHEICKKNLRSYGIDKLMKLSHEVTWRDGGESFTLRTKAAPKKGGDEALQQYTAKQQSLGWRYGYYNNYVSSIPVNEHWDEDGVARLPNNDWVAGWPRTYRLKPSRAPEFEAKLAPMIRKKYGSDVMYTDLHTCAPPWSFADYDARVPGAGTFVATFYAYGELLRNDQSVYGPTFSEGGHHWFYAGLVTGSYAQCRGLDLYNEPLNVAFDLLKIHPLSCDIGMGYTSWHFNKGEIEGSPGRKSYAFAHEARYPDENIDRFIAATLAYGHIGWLVERQYGTRRICRSYYMIQQASKRYAMEKVKRIRYADEHNHWLTASEAIATGVINESRLHVEYENGLNLFVNWSRDNNWAIPPESTRPAGRTVLLPPSGWCVFDGDGFFEASHLRDGNRVDEVVSPEYVYLDGRDKWAENGYLAAKGGAAMRTKAGAAAEIVNIGGNMEIGFRAQTTSLTCTAFDANGESLGEVTPRFSRGYAFIPCFGVRSCKVVQDRAPAREEPVLSLKLSTLKAPPGEDLKAKVKARAPDASPVQVRGLWVGPEREEAAVRLTRTSLAPSQAYEQTVPLRLPANVAAEEHLWFSARAKLRVHGKEKEAISYADLYTIPAIEIRLDNPKVVLKNGKASLLFSVKNNLAAAPPVAIRLSLSDPSLSVKPAQITIPSGRRQALSVNVIQEKPAEVRKAVLTMNVAVKNVAFRQILKFKVETSRPVFANLHDSSVPFTWTMRVRGGEEKPGDRRTGASFGRSREMPVGGVRRDGLFSHPPYKDGVGYTAALFDWVKLPTEPAELHVFLGLMDGGAASDGVDYSAIATTRDGQCAEVFKAHGEQKAWKEVNADLRSLAGKDVQFKFIADVGPNDSAYADWACWGEPVIRAKETRAVLAVLSSKTVSSAEEEGLVGWWKFDEGKGTLAMDSSGNGNHGEIAGATWVKAKAGSALRFDGDGAFVCVEHSDVLTPDEFTIEAWVKPASAVSTDRGPMIVSKYGGNWRGYMLLLEGRSGKPGIHIDTPQAEETAVAPEALKLGQWHHLAGTYDGQAAKIYVNGKLQGSVDAQITHDQGRPLTIGKASWVDQAYFAGVIDEVKVYDRALTAMEIRARSLQR